MTWKSSVRKWPRWSRAQNSHTVRLANGDLLNSHAVILATGGSPQKLQVPGEMKYYGQGVSYCATCDGFFFREKTVVVVGDSEPVWPAICQPYGWIASHSLLLW